MNKNIFFQIKKVLIIVLALFSINLSAKDRIDFNWTGNIIYPFNYNDIYIRATEGKCCITIRKILPLITRINNELRFEE